MSSSPPPPPSGSSDAAARDALKDLQDLATAKNYADLGFDSLEQVRQAQLGQPMEMYDIGLDAIRSYKPGMKIDGLWTKSSETIYPVTVHGAVKSSVTVVQDGQGYEPSGMGGAPIVKELSRYRQAASDSVVSVPGLNLTFLGRRSGGDVLLTLIFPAQDLPTLPPGRPTPAGDVLQLLVPLAKGHSGLPR